MAFHLPKIFSQVAQIIFYDPKKFENKLKTSPQNRENVFVLIHMHGWHKKNRGERQGEKYRLGRLEWMHQA